MCTTGKSFSSTNRIAMEYCLACDNGKGLMYVIYESPSGVTEFHFAFGYALQGPDAFKIIAQSRVIIHLRYRRITMIGWNRVGSVDKIPRHRIDRTKGVMGQEQGLAKVCGINMDMSTCSHASLFQQCFERISLCSLLHLPCIYACLNINALIRIPSTYIMTWQGIKGYYVRTY